MNHTRLEEIFMKKTLVEKIKSKYTKESQIKTIELEAENNKITIFYIESMVDKTLFSTSLLSPLQKFLKEHLRLLPENFEH